MSRDSAMTNFETLGQFYLGREYDLDAKTGSSEPLMYDSKDLLTHAVCVGMTGSGKTGLCLGLLEEAAIDGIPALVIDPKGDLANLLLTFPNLSPEEFRPWINEEEAQTKGLTPEAFAAQQADFWKNGLSRWGQDGARIARLRQAADFTIYTPGSNAGIPVSVLRSFNAPDASIVEDREAFAEQINSTVTSLLGLLKINADPVQSREHILLANLLSHAWREGRSLDLPTLILEIQKPPVQRFGVMDVETFYPEKERFQLAMALNNLIASPGFELWMEGEPLEISQFLYTAEGKPRVAIFSIAHLSDTERMFFVSMLLNQTVSWMRRQSGTTSLRALLYMDEIFGYFPPVANPPSKGPLLTLLKQARAFGLGVVLATQNPVDLDYKGLSNCGTWFLGRLQTENDKKRVMDGLQGASLAAGAAFDVKRMDEILSGVGKRVFLLHNVNEPAPVVFETRWALSYLRGPLTRAQIARLTAGRKDAASSAPASPAVTTQGSAVPPPPPPSAAGAASLAQAAATARPTLPVGIEDYFLPARNPAGAQYVPAVIGFAKVHYSRANPPVDESRDVALLAHFDSGPVPLRWESAERVNLDVRELERSPADGVAFASLPSPAADARNYRAWEKDLAQYLYTAESLPLFRSKQFKAVSKPGETERDFRLYLQQLAREQRDQEVAKLREKHGTRLARLEERIFAAQQKLSKEQADVQRATTNMAVNIG
ncbi:MAG: ATP-binding protein, partial [Bryobacterales bacterium]|nr:ATP-binding protein [Bryobacterales bacterium]